MMPLLEREMKHLFSRGEGGRHDWMHFHATDVPCPETVDLKAAGLSPAHPIPCGGYLNWTDVNRTHLKCVECGTVFEVKKLLRIKKRKERHVTK